MAIKGYCGGECGGMEKCNKCSLDLSMPCSPSCDNLTEDGMIKIAKCLADGCEEVKYIFKDDEAETDEEILGKTDEEIIAEYGEVAEYPYWIE